MHKGSLHIPRFLQFRRLRSPKSNSSNGVNISSSSHPSPELGRSQQAQGSSAVSVQTVPNDSAGQLTHDSQAITSLVKPQILDPQSSVATPPINPAPPSQTTDSDPFQHQVQLLDVAQPSPATHSQSQPPIPFPLHQPQDGNSGTLNFTWNAHESRNVSVQGDGNYVHYNVNSSNRFMAELLEKTIPGAAFDSSTRDPPPRCHPGTRLAVLARCLEFIANAIGTKKMRWVVGKAGVGKSAIMQSVADSSFSSEAPGASIFFSINGRNDGAKAVITFAYQLAASCEPYRTLIEYEITRKPSLLQSSLAVQFKKFVIEPFTHQSLLDPVRRVLIIIDGLDECDKSHTQRELLQLISNYCSTYPSSPIVWLIASRPEPHITSFFAQDTVKAVYEKEEILVDSDEAREDVEKYLRDELTRIQYEFSLNPQLQWPLEQDLWILANASGGLFVYADTVIKYVGDRTFGNPTSQLNDVLKVIDAHPLPNVSRDEHPMARLDVLYAQILSKVPGRIMVNTRRILLGLILNPGKEFRRPDDPDYNFLVFCNWLGMTCDDAYAAIRHLLSVLDAPPRNEADRRMLGSFHKSFIDYISDFTRSGFSYDIEHEAYQLGVECTLRILGPIPGGIDVGDTNLFIRGPVSSQVGFLTPGSGTGANIWLSWPFGEETNWPNHMMRLELYKLAVATAVEGIRKGEPAFCTEFCIRLVTSQFDCYIMHHFPYRELQNVVFERSRRHEFIKHGILNQLPVKLFHFNDIAHQTPARLQFRRPTASATNPSDPWNPSCEHYREGSWGEGKHEDWATEFHMESLPLLSACDFCRKRLEQHFDTLKSRSPDHVVSILFTSTSGSFAEFQFIDPDDGVSEWTYWFEYYIKEDCRNL